MCFLSNVCWAGALFFVIICHYFNIWRHFLYVIYLLWVGDVFYIGKFRARLAPLIWHHNDQVSNEKKANGTSASLKGACKRLRYEFTLARLFFYGKLKTCLPFELIPGDDIQWHKETFKAFTTKSQRFLFSLMKDETSIIKNSRHGRAFAAANSLFSFALRWEWNLYQSVASVQNFNWSVT